MRGENSKGSLALGALLVILVVSAAVLGVYVNTGTSEGYKQFSSCSELTLALRNSAQAQNGAWELKSISAPTMLQADVRSAAESMDSAAGYGGSEEYSTTNVQVAGVDEADIVKNDGKYIYAIYQSNNYGYGIYYDVAIDTASNEMRDLEGENPESSSPKESMLVIVDAYPGEEASVLSRTGLGDFVPSEMFIEGDRLLVFGNTYREIEVQPGQPIDEPARPMEKMIAPYPYRTSLVTLMIFDISDRENPELVRTADFEGSYLTSRKIGTDVYFVVNSYPRYQLYDVTPEGGPDSVVPVYRDTEEDEEEFKPACGCDEVSYFDGVVVERLITIASISMDDDNAEIQKEVIAASGQNVYASHENLYIAEEHWPVFLFARTESGIDGDTNQEETVIHKFSLDNGKVTYDGYGSVPGRILNQFSMDEYDGNFRIATTAGRLSRTGGSTSNNVYVLNEDMERVGEIEGIAPGESIYSARFIGHRGYLVTFKKIDPFFVIDLSDPYNPEILGKLKIPGYSDYLHPYDENHIIGIGKETVEAEEEAGDFSWYQGVKMAIFDVTDVENPTEMHRVIIGDRGTDSEALRDHKAFLFDREKELLVIPILLAEMRGDKEKLERWNYGDYVYQGAYVYDVTLEDGFQLKGRVTHVDDDDVYLKSGYYYAGGEYAVKRSLYIGDNLYTVSNSKIKVNSLSDLSELGELSLPG